MTAYIQNFRKFQPLLRELVARDIKIKYRRSALGVLWTLLNPLLMMIILAVVFSNLFGRFEGIDNFPLYLLSGQLIFTFFSESTTSGMSSIINSASLIKKIYIPKYLFVISRIISSLINLMATFTALILVMLVMRANLHYTVFLCLIPILLLVLFSLGIGLILSAVAVQFRDIIHLYTVFTMALLYLTPVIYPISILPDWLYPIVRYNPVSNYLIMFRQVMLDGTLFDWTSLVYGIITTTVALVLGCYVFYKRQDDFILYV